MFKSVSPQVDFPELENELVKKMAKEKLTDKYLHEMILPKKTSPF